MSTHGSEACCKRVAVAIDYDPKGSYTALGGTKCYVTGPRDASTALYVAYDIFGYTGQTLQGADILATHGKEQYLVIVPDHLLDDPANPAWFASQSDENQSKIQAFMTRIGNPEPTLKIITATKEAAQKEFPSIRKWGAIGYCWGGKLVTVTSSVGALWAAALETSPAMVAPEDGKKISIPFAILASSEESADVIKAKHAALAKPGPCLTFEGVHGFMSARADLKDVKARADYERGYEVALTFFQQNL